MRAEIMQRTQSFRDLPSSCDAETQYEKPDKQTGPQKYWNEGVELELQAVTHYAKLNLSDASVYTSLNPRSSLSYGQYARLLRLTHYTKLNLISLH